MPPKTIPETIRVYWKKVDQVGTDIDFDSYKITIHSGLDGLQQKGGGREHSEAKQWSHNWSVSATASFLDGALEVTAGYGGSTGGESREMTREDWVSSKTLKKSDTREFTIKMKANRPVFIWQRAMKDPISGDEIFLKNFQVRTVNVPPGPDVAVPLKIDAPPVTPLSKLAWVLDHDGPFTIFHVESDLRVFASDNYWNGDRAVQAHQAGPRDGGSVFGFEKAPNPFSSKHLGFRIVNKRFGEYVFVSNDLERGDNVVETHRSGGQEPRDIFELHPVSDAFGVREGVFTIFHPSSGKYLFVSNTNYKDADLVEAHPQLEARNEFLLERL